MNQHYFILYSILSASTLLHGMEIPISLENQQIEIDQDIFDSPKNNCACLQLKKHARAALAWLRNRELYLSNTEANNLKNVAQIVKCEPRKFQPKQPKIKFTDVIGDIPRAIKNIVYAIRRSPENTIHVEKILLHGPSGTGKSSLAEAIAGELDWDFYHVFSSALIDKWQGSGNKNIVELFDSARQSRKGAVVFLDEIDGIANEKAAESQSEIARTINSLHKELDGLNTNIICIIATNFLDRLPATIKSRFNANPIHIDLPEFSKRLALLQKLLDGYALDLYALKSLAKETEGFSCRDLYNLLDNARKMSPELFDKKNQVLTLQDKMKFKEILIVASYTIQDHKLPGFNERKIILHYWFNELMQGFDDEQFNQLINSNAGWLKHLENLSGQAIEQCILLAHKFKNIRNGVNFNAQDLIAGIYFNNPKKIPDTILRKLLIQYFFELEGFIFNSEVLQDISEALTDDFSGKDIKLLISKAIQLAGSAHLPDEKRPITIAEIYKSISESLEEKAKPFKVIEHSSKNPQYMPVGSLNASTGGSIGINGFFSGSLTGNAGGSYNLAQYHITEFPGFMIERIALKDKSDFTDESATGSNDDKSVRLEMRNRKSVNASCVYNLLTYFLIFERMNLDNSMLEILSSKKLIQIIFNGGISITTLKDIFCLTISLAKEANRDACLEADLLQALELLSFNVKRYANIPLNENCKELIRYRAFINQYTIADQQRNQIHDVSPVTFTERSIVLNVLDYAFGPRKR